METQLNDLESLIITNDNILTVLQTLDSMKNELLHINDNESVMHVQDRIENVRSTLINSNSCEQIVETLIRIEDKASMAELLSLIDQDSVLFKKLKSALEKSEAEVNSHYNMSFETT